MSAPDFTFSAERAGDAVVVTLAGELDMAVTFRLEPELERLTGEADVHALVVEMSGVTFMDSSALGLLLATQQRLRADGVRFAIANPSTGIRRILEITGAGQELTVTDEAPGA